MYNSTVGNSAALKILIKTMASLVNGTDNPQDQSGETTLTAHKLARSFVGSANDVYPIPHMGQPRLLDNLSLLGLSVGVFIVGLLGLAAISDIRAKATASTPQPNLKGLEQV